MLLFALGVRTLLRPPKPKPPRTDPTDPAPHLGRYFGIGVALMLTNFSTIVLYVPAMKDVAIADTSTGVKAVVVAVVLAFAAAPAWVPVVFSVAAPERADRTLGALNRFLATHHRAVSVTVCFVFGAYLVVKGARAL